VTGSQAFDRARTMVQGRHTDVFKESVFVEHPSRGRGTIMVDHRNLTTKPFVVHFERDVRHYSVSSLGKFKVIGPNPDCANNALEQNHANQLLVLQAESAARIDAMAAEKNELGIQCAGFESAIEDTCRLHAQRIAAMQAQSEGFETATIEQAAEIERLTAAGERWKAELRSALAERDQLRRVSSLDCCIHCCASSSVLSPAAPIA
jgi:hypothetical protein